MLKSTQTIYSIIEFTAGRYKAAKDVTPSAAYMSPHIFAQLVKEIGPSALHHSNILEMGTSMNKLNTMYGVLDVVIVQESKTDFLLVGQENDYLDYVIERTVL